MGKVKDMKKALEKHYKGELDEAYYGPDGELYPSAVLGTNPEKTAKKLHERDKEIERKKIEQIKKEYEEGKRILRKEKEFIKIDKPK